MVEQNQPDQQGQADPVPTSISGFLFLILGKILKRKKYLLIPLWILLATVALLILFGGGSSILPVIYIAF